MTLWRLEWLRLVRTRRLLALVGGFLFYGLIGPVLAHYLPQIVNKAGGRIKVTLPPTVPADGVTQYLSNASQIGMLVVAFVAAAALSVDARKEMAVFLRSRVATPGKVILPAFVVNSAVASAAFVVGTLAAWYETLALLGHVPAAAMLEGMGLGILFFTFVVALTALVAALSRSVLATAGLTLVTLILLGLIGQATHSQTWLPTLLLNALDGLLHGTAPGHYLRASAVTVVAGVAALAGAVRLSARREL
jgi:ABC-2 type transport system permease protein